MKIEAFKSDNGKLFETENEAKIENLTEIIFQFLKGDTQYGYYVTQWEREKYSKEFAARIVKDRREFLALFNMIKGHCLTFP